MDKKKNILIVCTGNSCRSPMAEAILKYLLKGKSEYEITSAGTNAYEGTRATPEAVEAMLESGLDITRHRARKINSEMIDEAFFILAMASYHKEYVLTKTHNMVRTRSKTYLLSHFDANEADRETDIEDPIGQSLSVYRKCKKRIYELLEKFVEELNI